METTQKVAKTATITLKAGGSKMRIAEIGRVHV